MEKGETKAHLCQVAPLCKRAHIVLAHLPQLRRSISPFSAREREDVHSNRRGTARGPW